MPKTKIDRVKIALLVILLTVAIFTMKRARPLSLEDELASTALNFIIQSKIGIRQHIQSNDPPWAVPPITAKLIVWAPPLEMPVDSNDYLALDQSLKVWWFADNELRETSDKIGAIEQYQAEFMNLPTSSSWAWGYYQFGILSISADGRQAEIFISSSCGISCGDGNIYTFQRNFWGYWELIHTQPLWVS